MRCVSELCRSSKPALPDSCQCGFGRTIMMISVSLLLIVICPLTISRPISSERGSGLGG